MGVPSIFKVRNRTGTRAQRSALRKMIGMTQSWNNPMTGTSTPDKHEKIKYTLVIWHRGMQDPKHPSVICHQMVGSKALPRQEVVERWFTHKLNELGINDKNEVDLFRIATRYALYEGHLSGEEVRAAIERDRLLEKEFGK